MYDPDQFDHLILNVGINKCGKSYLSVLTAIDIARQAEENFGADGQCRIVIHDSGSSCVRREKGVQAFKTLRYEEYRVPITKYKETSCRIFLIATAEAEDGLTTAKTIRDGTNQPVILIIDEITLAQEIHTNGVNRLWRTPVALRRHEKFALIFNMVSPSMASRYLSELATEFNLFRLEHDDALALVAKKGFNQNEIERCRTLDQGEYLRRSTQKMQQKY